MITTQIYIGLFLSSFLSATILPGQSEIALTSLIILNNHSISFLVSIASLGNVLGSLFNWFIGCKLERFKKKKWFPVTDLQLKKASNWYHKYGKWTLLLSWVPFVGDPLTIVAGIFRVPIMYFILIVSFAKTMRYIFIASIALNFI
jgi:membrane protein YqaA with SNARE-associated domain|tara:strand:+ start:197 stop:634 length:438 start_codon:yes stop_codon:yes gene_type:complete